MTDRDRLIELIKNAPRKDVIYGDIKLDKPAQTVQSIADHLLANGVIVPPCKVGQTVYTYGAKRVKDWKITFCGKNSRGEHKMIAADDDFKNMLEFWDYDVGKTVFLTKEEAERALKEREGE